MAHRVVMQRIPVQFILVASLVVLGACSSEGGSTTTVTPTTVTPTTVAAADAQPAIWPAADVVFTDPESAANDFLANAFDDGPMLGTFMAGDSRSGEFEVFATEGGAPIGEARSVLFMRQLGPDDGWFVLSAASDVETITQPASMATVPAGMLTVEGVGSGFEATIVVSAFVSGRPDSELDREVTMAGNFGELLPYTVSLDLSAASSGDVVVLLIRGGVGLETDPGDFGAIPVVIA